MDTGTKRSSTQRADDITETDEAASDSRPIAIPDPAAFFRREGEDEARATYARTLAQRTAPPSQLTLWGRAVRAPMALWAIVPMAVAAGYLWAQNLTPAWTRTQLLAGLTVTIAIILAVFGLNLLRSAAQATKIPSNLMLAPRAQIGAVLVIVAGIMAALAVRGASRGVFILGMLCLAAAIGYALTPLVPRRFPGLELLPALLLGPGLYFFMLNVLQGRFLHVTNGTWLLAGALFGLLSGCIIAGMLGETRRPKKHSLRKALGERNLRFLYVMFIGGAYGLIILASTGHHTSHAALAVLLSLPVAILPITGVIAAKMSSALRIIAPQTQRLLIMFGVWIAVGFLLGGIYLRLLSRLHSLPGFK